MAMGDDHTPDPSKDRDTVTPITCLACGDRDDREKCTACGGTGVMFPDQVLAWREEQAP